MKNYTLSLMVIIHAVIAFISCLGGGPSAWGAENPIDMGSCRELFVNLDAHELKSIWRNQ